MVFEKMIAGMASPYLYPDPYASPYPPYPYT